MVYHLQYRRQYFERSDIIALEQDSWKIDEKQYQLALDALEREKKLHVRTGYHIQNSHLPALRCWPTQC